MIIVCVTVDICFPLLSCATSMSPELFNVLANIVALAILSSMCTHKAFSLPLLDCFHLSVEMPLSLPLNYFPWLYATVINSVMNHCSRTEYHCLPLSMHDTNLPLLLVPFLYCLWHGICKSGQIKTMGSS